MGKRYKPWQHRFHPMLREVDARAAAMSANGKEPRKHHLVPRFYLERWSENGKLRMTDLDEKRTFTPAPSNAARQTDFYRVEGGPFSDGGSPIRWEVFLGMMEERAAGIMRALVDDELQVAELPPDDFFDLAWFVALQMTRGVSFRRGMQWIELQESALRYESGGVEAMRRLLRKNGADDSDEAAKRAEAELLAFLADPTKLPMLNWLKVRTSEEMARRAAHQLARRRFVIYRGPAKLVTSDEPVVALDVELGSEAGNFGLMNAPVLAYPIAPDVVLAMFRPGLPVLMPPSAPLTMRDVLDLNQAVLGNAYRYGFERPAMNLTNKLYIPPQAAGGVRRSAGRTPEGMELHLMRPGRRWAGVADSPSRPVERWWPRPSAVMH